MSVYEVFPHNITKQKLWNIMTVAMKYWAEWYTRVHDEMEEGTDPNIY